jgi:[acyl-carrier-protein] S-malonyltransferase
VKQAFIFPGQGSQKVGMTRDLYDKYDVVKSLLKEADETLGFSLSRLMFEGPDTELVKTEFTQPAVLTAGVAVARVLAENGIFPDVAAGHSLGEYTALVAACAMDFSAAVHTVHLRGKFMQEAVPLGAGGMAAVMGLASEEIVSVCETVSKEKGAVEAVNFNCPGQTVIAGKSEAVAAACDALKEAGAKRAIPLNVSAPFHSSLMEPAAARLQEVLDTIEIRDAAIPVMANVNAKEETKAADIRDNLVRQAAHAVHWEESVRAMIAAGTETFVEVGPGTVLSGFMRKIDKTKTSLHAEDEETVRAVTEALKA